MAEWPALSLAATAATGMFAGTAAYLNYQICPEAKDDDTLEIRWKSFPHMYSRAAKYQASLAAVGGLSAITYSAKNWDAEGPLWLGAGGAVLSVIPFTYLFIMPTNKVILGSSKDEPQPELLSKWNRLHFVRTLAGVTAFGLMLYGCSRARRP